MAEKLEKEKPDTLRHNKSHRLGYILYKMSYLESDMLEDIIKSSIINSASRIYQVATLPAAPNVYGRIKSWILDEEECLENFPAENILKKIENVRLLDRYNMKNHLLGILYLSPTNLIFIAPENKKETWIMFSHIASVDKMPLTTTGSPLQIRCKTFLSVTFIIQKERDCHEVYTKLQQVSQPVRMEDLYCFHYNTEDIPKSAGWTFFDLQAEFQRMRVPNDQWNLTILNKDYDLCDTYPRVLYVPASATTSILLGSSKFRSKGRLPVLTYVHGNKAVICRCSQPLSGFKARCYEDEQMLDCVLKTNPNAGYMYVVDTRPRINAMANRAAGKGYESETFYDNIKFHFLGIENIHVMRNSLAKLIETCELKQPSMSSFLSGIESSGWLRHIQSVLETSGFIAQAVNAGISVVVHCSDGWDRTAQVCSLASLLLDNYYRTIQGYQALIEKDWLAFGHKFTDRCGFVAGDPKELSPVFTQFIECTWQLTVQFPSAFQFNESFLLTLHDHLTSCQYGTFIGNCEKDRLDLRLNERTYSLWGYMANRMNEYINPLYSDSPSDMLKPNLASQNIRFWRGMYCRFENGIHPRENLNDLILSTCDHSSSLEDHIRLLQKRITSVKQKLSAYGDRVKTEILERTTKDAHQTIDNKLLYDKVEEMTKFMENEETVCGAEMKLAGVTETNSVPEDENSLVKDASVDVLSEELDSVALDWKTLRNVKECPCSTQFDHFSSKYHCWKCGGIFCTRCIVKHIALPGHLSQRAVPVCSTCYHQVTRSGSSSSP